MSSSEENTLPEGWKMLKLSDVCDLFNGYAFKAKEYVEKSNTVIVRMGNIRPNGTFDIEHKIKYLPNKYSEELTRYRLNDGDLILAMTDLASEMRILGNPTLIKGSDGRNLMLNQRVGKLHKFNFNLITKEYLRFILTSKQIKDYYKSLGGGGLQINIGKQQILSVTIPIPPLEEQKRIVAKIDTLFAKIDKAITLTETSLVQAKNLLPSVLKEVFEKGKADGWEEKKLGEIAFLKSGSTPRRSNKSYWEAGTIPWLKSGELNDSMEIKENSEFITEIALDETSVKLFTKDTLLIAMYGATAGKLGILSIDATTNQAVCSIQNKKEMFNNHFMFYFLYSMREKIISDSFGGAQPNISKTYLENLSLYIPNLSAQEEVANLCDELSIKAKQTQSKLEEQLAYLKQLKSSILSKAFKGEL